MPQPRLSMRKVKEIRRLHYELRLGQRQIRPLLLDLSERRPRLLEAGRNAGLPWPLPPDCDEASSKSACSADVWLGRPVIAGPNPATTRFLISSWVGGTQ